MRRRRGPAITIILAVLLTVVGVLITPAPAGAAGISGIGLPLERGRDVVVDPGTGRIFVSGDDAVVVRTPTGATLKTITGIPGALDLAAAGGAVYAVGATSHRIARIDPVGLTITRTYTLPVTPLLRGVTLHDGRLWTVADTGSSSRALVSIDTATGTGVIWSEIELGAGPMVAVLSTPSTSWWSWRGASPPLPMTRTSSPSWPRPIPRTTAASPAR